jgi:hypothetical protein
MSLAELTHFHSTLDQAPLPRQRLARQASAPAATDAVVEVARSSGIDAQSMRVAIGTERMLARPGPSGVPASELQWQPLLLSPQQAERVSGGTLVQAYPGVDYDFVIRR